MLSQLSSKLWRSRGREEVFSTTDSGVGQAETQDEAPRLLSSTAGPDERKTAKSKALKSNNASASPSLPNDEALQPSRNKRVVVAAAPAQNTHEKSSSHKKFHSVGHSNEAANTTHIVWRPW